MARVINDTGLLEEITAGSQHLADLLKPNFGPNGRNTIFDQKYDISLIVNTGKKILPEIQLEDRVQNLGAALLRDAAMKNAEKNGDGTIMTVILADAMISYGKKLIAAGASPVRLRNSIKKSIPLVERAIMQSAIPADSPEILRQTASVAADSRELGELAAEAFEAAGKESLIQVRDSQERANRLEVAKGIFYEYGLQSSGYMTDPVRHTAVLKNPYILLVDKKIKKMEQLKNILNQIIRKKAPLFIVTQDMDQQLTNILLANHHKKVFQLAVANGPGHGSTRRRHMQALAAKTGAVLIDDDCGLELENCSLEICGRAERIVAGKDSTLIQGLENERAAEVDILKRRVKKLLDEETDRSEIEKLQDTAAILNGHVVTIVAGGVTEYEMFENMHQLENAVSAVYAASRSGVVAGGGKGYLLALPTLEQQIASAEEDDRMGYQCVKEALLAPVKCIAENVGENGACVATALLERSDSPFLGFDSTDHCLKDFRRAGIYDPADTLCTAFKTAAEISGILLTVSGAVFT